MHSPPNRALVRALTVSLLAHAALLLGVAPTLPVRIDVPAAAVRVVMNPVLPAGERQAEPLSSSAEHRVGVSPAPEVPRIAARKLTVPESPSRDHAVPAAPPSLVMPDAVASSSSAPVGSRAKRAADGPASTGTPLAWGDASPQPQEGVSADDVASYRLSLGGAAQRFKRYPPLARERGWEGTAEVALDFHRLNAVPVISLVASSGKKILDDQALEMIRLAVRETGLPNRMKGREFRVRVEITFSLEDDQ